MVEAVGIKTTSQAARVSLAPAPVGATLSTPRVAAGADEARVTLPGVARSLAAGPPVDVERVARIKKAIADGKFPIYPATIADRLLALKLQWNPNDAA